MRRSIIALATAAALLPAFRAQDDDPKKELEKAKQQIAELQKENDRLQRAIEESALEVMRLRVALKERPTPTTQPTQPTTDPKTAQPTEGPPNVMKGKVYAVDPKFQFVVINLGELDGVKPGYRFEIVRYDEKNQMKRIAVAEFEKFIGDSKAQSKLKVVEGNAGDIKFEDVAIAFRSTEPPKKTDLPPTKTDPTDKKKFVIKGTDGDTLWLNYGTGAGAKQTDVVYVYRDGKLRAKLRIDQVDKDWSAAKIIDGSKVGDLAIGDEISLKEQKTAAIGTVKFNDERRGMIVDVGSQTHNVKVGQKFEVRRNGRKVGDITLKSVEKTWSYADLAGDTKREDIQVGDIVESVD